MILDFGARILFGTAGYFILNDYILPKRLQVNYKTFICIYTVVTLLNYY